MHILNQQEIDFYLSDKVKEELGLRNATIMRLFLHTGLRVSELVGLDIADVFYQTEPKKFILVRAEIAKRGQGREIPVSPKLSEWLRVYYSSRCSDIGTVGLDGAAPLFSTLRLGWDRLTVRQVQRIISMCGDLLGRQLHPHTLRHTFATLLMRQTNIRIVQTVLGHKSLQSTQIYTHPSSEDLTGAVKGL